MIEPKIGEIFSLHGIKVKTCLMKDGEHCSDCAFAYLNCSNIVCCSGVREGETLVIFKEVKEMEVKIQIPDNCELVKDGDSYVVMEKNQNSPRSWEEFCERYPKQLGEVKIDSACNMYEIEKSTIRRPHTDRNVYTSKEEAEAFLALMQLRQLRKAWVGDWEQTSDSGIGYILYDIKVNRLTTGFGKFSYFITLSFPTKMMAEDFLNCFKDLCETAKILL